jgi:DNA polymerase (family 10)
MPIHNSDIADCFERMADHLEIGSANPFRVRAYRNAARTIRGLPESVSELLEKKADLTELPGIGDDLANKIEEIVETGHLSALEGLERKTASALPELMKLPGLGAKRVKVLYDELGISNLHELQTAAEHHRVRELPGFGKRTEEKILSELRRLTDRPTRHKRSDIREISESLVSYLRDVSGVKQVVVAGSYRRRQETVGDLDILVTCKKGARVMERLVDYDEVESIISRGKTRASVVLRSNVQVDIRVVAEESFGAALYYFTGSKSHNIAIRKMALKRQLKINEYGVYQGSRRIAGKTEAEIFKQVGLPYIEPELRENTGEIEAALAGRLPKLISLSDIRGNLHTHTQATDGQASLLEMAEAAGQLGYEYLAITDHSKSVTIAKGLNARQLRKQLGEIDQINDKLNGIVLLKSIEVDILEDGKLDLENSILQELDLTVCSVHSKFNLSRAKQTERVIRAMDNPYFNIMAHPTGRLLNKREPYEIDMGRVMDAAVERGCFLELNAHPDRLDLNDAHCRLAKEKGLKVAISTDAHAITDLHFMQYGIDQARRGWLESGDILNTYHWNELRKLLRRKK